MDVRGYKPKAFPKGTHRVCGNRNKYGDWIPNKSIKLLMFNDKDTNLLLYQLSFSGGCRVPGVSNSGYMRVFYDQEFAMLVLRKIPDLYLTLHDIPKDSEEAKIALAWRFYAEATQMQR